jgi:HK97 gp10 family phage protein
VTGWEEFDRVQARLFISDVLHPVSFVLRKFEALQRAFHSGSMIEVFEAAFSHGASQMLQEVKAKCPVDTGALRDSLYVTTEDRTHEGGRDMAPHHTGRVGKLSVQNTFAYITTDSSYAYFVELGTRYMPAHPFMRPAVDQGMSAFVERVGDIVVSNIMTAFAGRMALAIGDVFLGHASTAKQKHSLARDVTVTAALFGIEKLVGKLGGGAKVASKSRVAKEVSFKGVAKATVKTAIKTEGRNSYEKSRRKHIKS